jgi:pentatricopeptide repeat protein
VTNLVRWGTTHVALTAKFTRLSGLQFAFAALERRLYAAFRKRARRVTFKHDLRCARLSWFLFATGASPSPQKLWYRWVKLDISTRKAYVHRLLIYFLDRKPGRALRFIQVLANDPLLRGRKQEAIADALSHLSALHRQGVYEGSSWGTDIEAHKREFVPIFLRIFVKTLSGQRDICSEDLLYGLTQLAKTEDLKKVFDCLVERKVHLTFDTLLHYAQTFGEAGEVEYALKCLETLKKRHLARTWEDVVQRKRLRWTCAVILRRSMTTTKDFYHTPYIVAAFVRLGIQMDLLLYNVVIHNAMEAGDHATAFKVYNTFEENKLQPDKYTFGIMLHGCTMQDDPAYFQSFAQYCEEVAQDIRDPWLATDCLYYVYVRHRLDRDADKISALIWQSYARLFSAAPLQSFVDHGTPSLRNAVMSQDPSTRENTHLPPPATALYIMLQTEIQSALAISNMRVYNLYLKFKSVAEEGGTPEFDELVKRPIIWNAFLYAFCQKQQFATASQLIQDMTNGPAKPNVYSWNIFMQAFFKEGQVQAAERIFEIMRDRGVDPDQYTWGVMLRGYAKAQQIDRIDETLPHLEPENESDPGILAFLAKVVDRRKLMNVLEKNRLNKEATAQERAEQEAEAERSWWHDELANVEADSTTTEDATSTHLGATGSYVLGTSVQPTKEQSNLADIRAVRRNGTTSLPSGATDLSVLEDDISLIGERSRLLQDRASYLPTSKEPPRMPSSRPRIRRANPQDPEVQYRKLQERLGLVEPTAPTVEDRAELKAARKSRAGPVFKSMINRARNMPKGGDDVE